MLYEREVHYLQGALSYRTSLQNTGIQGQITPCIWSPRQHSSASGNRMLSPAPSQPDKHPDLCFDSQQTTSSVPFTRAPPLSVGSSLAHWCLSTPGESSQDPWENWHQEPQWWDHGPVGAQTVTGEQVLVTLPPARTGADLGVVLFEWKYIRPRSSHSKKKKCKVSYLDNTQRTPGPCALWERLAGLGTSRIWVIMFPGKKKEKQEYALQRRRPGLNLVWLQ